MTPEDRKDYNKTYYQQNRNTALEKACARVACVCCGRIITKNRLLNHMNTELCKRTQLNKNYINDRLNLTIEKQE